jgi:transcriptional regulator with XRE-family HTH domain
MKRGLKQCELAKALNIGKTTVSAYETNTTKPGIDIAILIADYFDVSLDYLFCRTEYPGTLVAGDTRELAALLEKDRIGLVKELAQIVAKYEVSKKF